MKKWVVLVLLIINTGCAILYRQPNSLPKVLTTELTPNFSQMTFNDTLDELRESLAKGEIRPLTDRGIFDNTLTHESVRNVEVLKLVLQYGAPLDDYNTFGDTPLSLAVARQYIPSAELLLSKGARTNLTYAFNSGLFFIAVKTNNEELVDLLIKYKVCPLLPGFMDDTVEEVVSNNLRPRVVKYINTYKNTIGRQCPAPKSLIETEKEALKK